MTVKQLLDKFPQDTSFNIFEEDKLLFSGRLTQMSDEFRTELNVRNIEKLDAGPCIIVMYLEK